MTDDEGQSWTPAARAEGIITSGSKAWGQRLSDASYAYVYNPVPNNTKRWPLALSLSADGKTYEKLLCINGEVPQMRYAGKYKDAGLNYVRGLEECDSEINDLWLVYSVNK